MRVHTVAPPAGAWIETVNSEMDFVGSKVAPPAGAWIETAVLPTAPPLRMSPLPQGRGLKRLTTGHVALEMCVAPPAGAWIETDFRLYHLSIDIVAPPAGAWIETAQTNPAQPDRLVAPPAGAWIETCN